MIAKYYQFCPQCGGRFPTDSKATTVCVDCHEQRLRHLREVEARYPSATQLGLVGTAEIPPQWLPWNRPHVAGKRIIRKGVEMGG